MSFADDQAKTATMIFVQRKNLIIMEIKKEIAEGGGLPGFYLFFKRQHDFAKNKPNSFKIKNKP